DDLLDGPIVHIDVVEAVEVLKHPATLFRLLDLGMPAGDAGVGQEDVAGVLAADEEPRLIEGDTSVPPLAVEDLQVLHGNAPAWGRGHFGSLTAAVSSPETARKGTDGRLGKSLALPRLQGRRRAEPCHHSRRLLSRER